MQISKKLSWALRHGIKDLGLSLNSAGYVPLQLLLSTPQFSKVSQEVIEAIVSSDNKNRYMLIKENGEVFIRANQGHSIKEVKDEQLLRPLTDPSEFPIIVHGTNRASWKLIKNKGLYKMKRNHIHFAVGLPGDNQIISGARHNCEVFIFIDIENAMNDGIKFFVSENNVVLSAGLNGFISPIYFSWVMIDKKPVELDYHPIQFDYILVLDFEANCVEHGLMECQEIIEFPVKALNCKTFQTDFVFHYYVKPVVVPTLSGFCTKLTGISQEMVENQESLEEVLSRFHQFLVDSNILQTKWIFLTCGDWDLKNCIRKEAEYKKIVLNNYFGCWLNIKRIVPNFKGGMMELLELFEIPHSGRHHSGIDDVENILQILKLLLSSKVEVTADDLNFIDSKGPKFNFPYNNPNHF